MCNHVRLHLRQLYGVRKRELSDSRAEQRFHARTAAEHLPHILAERADIRSLGTADTHPDTRQFDRKDLDGKNMNRTRRTFHGHAGPCQITQLPAVNL